MPSAWAPTVGRLASKVCIAACDFDFLPSRTRARRSSSFSLPPSRQEPGTRQSSRWTSAVCEARRPCFLTLAPCSQPLVPGGMTKAAWPREPSSRSTEAITTWTLAMPPLVAQAFWPLITHSSLASSYLAVVRIAETSEPASGSEAQKAPSLTSSGVPKHCGIHSPICSGGALPEDRGDGERGAHDRHPDAGVAPEQLLVGDRQRQAGLVGPELAQRFEAVEADLGGLLDHRPGRLLALVPLRGGGPDDALGEAVHPLADVLLVLVQLERELGAPPSGGGPPSPVTSASICSASATAEVSVMAPILHGTVSLSAVGGSDVAQVEGPQALGAFVGAVEEAPVDAVVGGPEPS